MTDYWLDVVSEAFEDAGITASKEQIDTVTAWVESSHDNYGMAHGYHEIPNQADLDNKALKCELEIERNKVICSECNGRGYITTHGPIHSGTEQCYRCNGEGRRTP